MTKLEKALEDLKLAIAEAKRQQELRQKAKLVLDSVFAPQIRLTKTR